VILTAPLMVYGANGRAMELAVSHVVKVPTPEKEHAQDKNMEENIAKEKTKKPMNVLVPRSIVQLMDTTVNGHHILTAVLLVVKELKREQDV